MDNTIDFMDQGSFLGLRARGRDPLIQICWVYDHAVDMAALRRFHDNLNHGLLGRRIERSPLPFGRHRWVTWQSPGIDVAPAPRPRTEVRDWSNEQAARTIDPERGPSWRMAVLPLTDGGAAVLLLVSHTIADGVGGITAATDAAKGITHDLGYPPARSRTTFQAMRQDAMVLIRGLPEVFKSILAAARVAKTEGAATATKKAVAIPAGSDMDRRKLMPSMTVEIDAEQWDACAKRLGGSAPTLLVGFGVRYAQVVGWVAADGLVHVSVPISERTPDDTRGNALTAVTFEVDPDAVTSDLTEIRTKFKDSLRTLEESGNALLGPLPLVSYVPTRVARRLESLVIRDKELGCSYLGELDPATNRPDGTDAQSMYMLPFEQHITYGDLRRVDGVFHPVISGRLNGKVWISIGYCNGAGSTTKEQLIEAANQVLADFGLSGVIE